MEYTRSIIPAWRGIINSRPRGTYCFCPFLACSSYVSSGRPESGGVAVMGMHDKDIA